MTEKEKATEMVRNQFNVIAKALNYKGLKKEGEKKFYEIENIAKQCANIGVDSIINIGGDGIFTDYWHKVKDEIIKL